MAEFKIVTLEALQSTSDETDWTKCFICQQQSQTGLQNPILKKGYDPTKNTYHTVADNLKSYIEQAPECLPTALKNKCSAFLTGRDLSQHLMQHKAVFHKNCISSFNKYKLSRKRKLAEKNLTNEDQDLDIEEEESVRKLTRRSINLTNYIPKCFFCDKATGEKLHQCQTFQVHIKVKVIAEEINDTIILAKLSEGDMIAIEAKYHCKCLLSYYEKSKSQSFSQQGTNDKTKVTCGIALSEVLTSIETELEKVEQVPIFKMNDIKKLYQNMLRYLDAPNEIIDNVHVTRLKNDILKQVSGLCEKKIGKFLILTLDGENGRALFKASQNSLSEEGIILSKAAKIIRKYMFNDQQCDSEDFSFENQKKSVCKELLQLISLILDDTSPSEENDITHQSDIIKLNLSQLIQFNSAKKKRATPGSVRHAKSNEMPLPVKIGLLLHSVTRKKSLVNKFAEDGIAINYQRVEAIQSKITKVLCTKYHKEKIVCPPKLRINCLTISAIDNIDHNPSSATASSSFHGTTISIFQKSNSKGSEQSNSEFHFVEQQEHSTLPESYTNIHPARVGKNVFPPTPNLVKFFKHDDKETFKEAKTWLNSYANDDESEKQRGLSFSSYYSNAIEKQVNKPNINVLLPIINESVNSPSVVLHCMRVITNITNHLNPGQMSVMVADQPVYTIAKLLQIQYKEEFKEMFLMLGPMHIEMAFMSAIGDWVTGSGWSEIFNRANISTVGRVESFLNGNKIKRTRYAHQLSLTSLVNLAHKAFKSQDEIESFENWRTYVSKKSPTAYFFFNLIDMETLLMMFVRSIRESNFELFLSCIQDMLPWMFSLDHIHYARWMTVHVADLISLEKENNTFFEEMCNGLFTINKSNRSLSSIAIDQAHEQNNKIVKIDGGAIGILESESAFLKWSVAGPVISDMLQCANSSPANLGQVSHHEDTESFNKKFRKEQRAFTKAIEEIGNPFLEEHNELIKITTKQIMSKKSTESVVNAKEIGKLQLTEFVQSRLISGSSSIHDTIKKNQLPLYRQKNSLVTSKSKRKLTDLNADCRLFSDLYIASQSRKGSLDDFFAHENHLYPVALSEYGNLRKCSAKSDFIKCLEEVKPPCFEVPVYQAKVIDGAVFVNIFQPRTSKTFGEYCYNELTNRVVKMTQGIERIDFVFDMYVQNSIKTQTRDSRGKGTRLSVRNDTPISQKFFDFMRNDENKNELFLMLANAFSELETDTVIVATAEKEVVSNKKDLDLSTIMPCSQEEADTRLLLHVLDASKKGYRKACVMTVDTDVVVIALYHYFDLPLDELWIEFGVGQSKRWLPIHDYANLLGEEICRALPFWFSFTGCDTVSMFSGRGKKTAWKVWNVFSEATQCFVSLASSNEINERELEIIERYVILLYDRTSSCTNVNECRGELFTKKRRSVENIPPTLDALKLHIKRASLQSKIWCDALLKYTTPVILEKWGWKINSENIIEPVWMTLKEASSSCKELIKCRCKKNCSSQKCKCKKQNLKCTELCLCTGGCDN